VLGVLSDHGFSDSSYFHAGCAAGVVGCGCGEGEEALAWLGERGEVLPIVGHLLMGWFLFFCADDG